MFKIILAVFIALGLAWLYGWRFHPEALPDHLPFMRNHSSISRPLVTRETGTSASSPKNHPKVIRGASREGL